MPSPQAGGQKVHVMKQKSQAHEKNVGKRKSGAVRVEWG